MSHYLKSLLISIFVYLSLFALALYALEKSEQFCKEESKSQKNSRVSISMIEQRTTPLQKKPQPVNKPKPQTVQKPKKKIVKKKPQIKKEVLVKKALKKVKPQEPIKEIAQAEEITTEVVQEIVESAQEVAELEQAVTQGVIQKTQTQESAQDLKARQDMFLAYLVERINSHKIYPHSARRRAIQGDVKMAFHVFANGNVENIRLVSGKKIFKKSAYAAIANSFPIEIDTTLFHFPKEFTITIAYILK